MVNARDDEDDNVNEKEMNVDAHNQEGPPQTL